MNMKSTWGLMFFVACGWMTSVLFSYSLGRHLERGATDFVWAEILAIVLPMIVGLGKIYKRVMKVPE